MTNCFCVPHKEYEERVEADLQYAQDMFDLNKKVAPQEALVGGFATGSESTGAGSPSLDEASLDRLSTGQAQSQSYGLAGAYLAANQADLRHPIIA